MIKFTLSVYYDPLIAALDRSITPCERYTLSSSVWRYAHELVHERTRYLTIPENDGKMFLVELNDMEVKVHD